jgi:diketogulonate reductase-like aldo/keto reductase
MLKGSRALWQFREPILGVSHKLLLQNRRTIPALGFGTYRSRPDEVGEAVKYAIKCGFRHVDCAKIYLNQKEVGVALREAMKENNLRREDLFVTSKLWPTDQHPDHVEKACSDTLEELQLDYLDLFLIHWPVCWVHTGRFDSESDRFPQCEKGLALVDESVDLADTWRAMMALVDKKKVLSLGVSNCNADQVDKILAVAEDRGADFMPCLNQIERHPGLLQLKLTGEMTIRDIVVAAYCPLGMPTRFTPPEFKGVMNDWYFDIVTSKTGFSKARFFLNLALDTGSVVIVKSTNKEHIRDNAKAQLGGIADTLRPFYANYERLGGHVRVVNPRNFTRTGHPFFDD